MKKKQKEKNGKLLDYSKCSDELKRKLDETRAKEWAKWKEFGASVVIDSKQLKELLDEGHQVIPTQWVELDKNYNKRLVDPTVEEKLKSRLVVRGDLEKGDPRSDSPTASLEAQNMVFSFAVSLLPMICGGATLSGGGAKPSGVLEAGDGRLRGRDARFPQPAAQRRGLRRVEAVHAQRLRGVRAPEIAAAVRKEAALPQHVPAGRPREGPAAVALVVGVEGVRGVDVGVGWSLSAPEDCGKSSR